jgi:23S rRNA (guanosine2251-2'-O)-methyltransferase
MNMSQELVFGIHAVAALLQRNPERIGELFVLDGRADKRMQALLQQAERAGTRVERTSRQALDKLVQGNHQGVIARVGGEQVAERLASWSEADLEGLIEQAAKPLVLVLDGVTDPHNLGACLRSADAAGVTAVIVPKDNAASITPVVRKVACGAAEVVPFIQVTNLARTMKQLQDAGLWIVGTTGEADESLYAQDMKGPLVIVMGAEGSGMRRLTKEHCDFLVKLPMAGSVSSLNVSVATGICLFEAVRQRQAARR